MYAIVLVNVLVIPSAYVTTYVVVTLKFARV